jgi:hypothetical protein
MGNTATVDLTACDVATRFTGGKLERTSLGDTEATRILRLFTTMEHCAGEPLPCPDPLPPHANIFYRHDDGTLGVGTSTLSGQLWFLVYVLHLQTQAGAQTAKLPDSVKGAASGARDRRVLAENVARVGEGACKVPRKLSAHNLFELIRCLCGKLEELGELRRAEREAAPTLIARLGSAASGRAKAVRDHVLAGHIDRFLPLGATWHIAAAIGAFVAYAARTSIGGGGMSEEVKTRMKVYTFFAVAMYFVGSAATARTVARKTEQIVSGYGGHTALQVVVPILTMAWASYAADNSEFPAKEKVVEQVAGASTDPSLEVAFEAMLVEIEPHVQVLTDWLYIVASVAGACGAVGVILTAPVAGPTAVTVSVLELVRFAFDIKYTYVPQLGLPVSGGSLRHEIQRGERSSGERAHTSHKAFNLVNTTCRRGREKRRWVTRAEEREARSATRQKHKVKFDATKDPHRGTGAEHPRGRTLRRHFNA